MGLFRHGAAMLAAVMLVTQPAMAAEDYREFSASDRRMAAFGGATVRLPLGGAESAKPSARLQFTTSYTLDDWRTGGSRTFKAEGLELGAAESGRAAIYLGGRNAAEVERSMRLDGSSETTYYIIGAVVFSALMIAFLSAYGPSSPGG